MSKYTFTSSPFQVVTQYEKEFIRKWNENTANAVAEVIQYVAKATAFAVKNERKGVKI